MIRRSNHGAFRRRVLGVDRLQSTWRVGRFRSPTPGQMNASAQGDAQFGGPWASVIDLTLTELVSYLDDAVRPELRSAVTRCAPWTGDELTSHLAATFWRFTAMLEQSRQGDLTAPFGRDALAAENSRAIASFIDDPTGQLDAAAERFCELVDDPSEIMAHQFGPIPVGLQAIFGLNELAIHHDDLLSASGRSYHPPPAVINALVPAWTGPLGHPDVATADDRWHAVLRASGR